MTRQRLTYESLEKLKVGRPVDRLGYISTACVDKVVLDIGCYDETALEKRGTDHWLHGRILGVAREVTGIDISDKIPSDGLLTGSNGKILRRDAVKLDMDGISVEQIQIIVAGEFIEHIESPITFFR